MTLTEIEKLLTSVKYPGYRWVVVGKSDMWYLQAAFTAPDCKTHQPAWQHTRKWYLSYHATPSEIVQTALKCVLTSVEHEAREVFTYRGVPIFSPHYDVNQLVALHLTGAAESTRSPA